MILQNVCFSGVVVGCYEILLCILFCGKYSIKKVRYYLGVFLDCFKVRLEFLFFMFFWFLWEDLRDVLLEVLRDALGVVEIFTNIWSKCSSSKTG